MSVTALAIVLRLQPELVLQAGGNRPWHSSGQDDVRGVGHIAGLGHNGLVTRIERGAKSQVNRLADTGGDQYLLGRIVIQSQIAAH